MTLRVATDVGGTFTDLVAFRPGPTGVEIITAKAHTTPQALDCAVLDVLAKASTIPQDIAFFAHGTTAIINAITERKGVCTAMVTTTGFRDTLEIARGNRPDFFNLSYKKPAPFVPRHLRFEVSGRIAHTGVELEPLDLPAVDGIASAVLAHRPRVEAIAVCLLHSYANSQHEDAVASRLRTLCPDLEIVSSSEVAPQWREYERGSTAVLSAYVAPIAKRYMARLAASLAAEGMKCRPYIMHSSCGVDTVEGASARPISLIESGPSAGVWAAAMLGEALGLANVLALDIGGTTAKCSLLPCCQVQVKSEHHVEKTPTSAGYPLLVPAVDIVEIGMGGGSLASAELVAGGAAPRLRVGPQSAGAHPGPASYGKGGDSATTTDANLALGRLNPHFFCGGSTDADMTAVEVVLGNLRAQLEWASTAEVARGIVRIANAKMANALKLVSVNRGFDPRDFTLVAFGGGGGMHACALARELGIGEVVVPRAAAVFSAWGMLVSDLRRDYVRTCLVDCDLSAGDSIAAGVARAYNRGVEQLEDQAITQWAATAGELAFEHHVSLRYQNQEHTVEVASDRRLAPDLVSHLLTKFHAQYEREYTYRLDAPVQLVSLRVVAKSPVGRLAPARLVRTGRTTVDAIKGLRLVDFDEAGVHEAVIFDASKLEPGMVFDGPAIVESADNVAVVYPGMDVLLDDYGNLRIKTSRVMEQQVASAIGSFGIVDAINEEIIQSGVQAAAQEMFVAMQHTAMSAIIYEVLDFGTAILDPAGELASSGAGIPGFVGLLHSAAKQVIAKFSIRGGILPGDIFALNDPYRGGATHLNDILILMPIFTGGPVHGGCADGTLVGWAANMAHYSDIGGLAPGSMSTEATDLFQEGLNLPGIKLVHGGVKNDAVFDIIFANSRMPDRLEGDLWAAIASVRTGDRRVRDLVAKYGTNTYLTAVAKYLDYGEALVLQSLKQLPSQRFELEEEQDSGIVYRVAVEIQNGVFIVDLTRSDDQHAGPFNLSHDGAVVCAMLLLKNLTSPQAVCNGGTFRPLDVRTRLGSVFNPRAPAAQGFYYEVLVQLYDLLWRAVASGLPRHLPAGHFASICGTIFGGTHPDTCRPYSVIEPELGGWGASADADGNPAVFSGIHGDTFNLEAEVAEARHGVLVRRYALSSESGGHGQWRGGKGVCIEYEVRSDDAWLTFAYTRSKFPPWGLNGGHPGTLNYIVVLRKSGGREILSSATGLRLGAGDVIQIHTGNGAGWGAPADRSRHLVVADVQDGYITAEDAQNVYGLPLELLEQAPIGGA